MFSTTSFRIRWDPVPPDHRNGIIKGYKIIYKIVDDDDDSDESTTTKTLLLPADAKDITMESLVPSANYDIELLAYTSTGNGVATKKTAGWTTC